MSTKANPRVIGGFVFGAVLLTVAAILTFGSGDFMADKITYVMFFDGSVRGLSAGAPVLFRGAPIGTVSSIALRYNTETKQEQIPVYMQIDRSKVQFVGGQEVRPGEGIQRLVDRGLRAQLILLSPITGQLAIQLNFFEDVPVAYKGEDLSVPELPTAPSLQEQLGAIFRKLQNVPLDEILADVQHAIKGLDELVHGDLKTTIKNMDQTLLTYQKLGKNLDEQVEPLVADIKSTTSDARAALVQVKDSVASAEESFSAALADVRRLTNNVDEKVDPLSNNLEETLTAGRDALRQAQRTLARAEGVISGGSPTMRHLNEALVELSATLRSIRVLADYLEQHPDSLFRGKGAPGG